MKALEWLGSDDSASHISIYNERYPNKLDDIKAHLPEDDSERLTDFEDGINHSIIDQVSLIVQHLETFRLHGIDRKTFAIKYSNSFDQFARSVIFKNFDKEFDHDTILFDVVNTIANNLSRTAKYEIIRSTWFDGIVYN